MSRMLRAFLRSRLPVGSSASRRVGNQRAGDGGALAFAARKFARPVQHAVFQADFFQHQQCPFPRLFFRAFADEEGHHHVFQGGKFGQQVVELVNEAEILVSQSAQLLLTQLGQVLPHQGNTAGGRFVQPAQDVQQGGFSAARRADDAYASAFFHLQGQVVQHLHVQLSVVIIFTDSLASQYGVTHNAKPPQVRFAPHASSDKALPTARG